MPEVNPDIPNAPRRPEAQPNPIANHLPPMRTVQPRIIPRNSQGNEYTFGDLTKTTAKLLSFIAIILSIFFLLLFIAIEIY